MFCTNLSRYKILYSFVLFRNSLSKKCKQFSTFQNLSLFRLIGKFVPNIPMEELWGEWFERNLGDQFFFRLGPHVAIKMLFILATNATPLEMRMKMTMDLIILEGVGSRWERVVYRESAVKSIQSNSMKALDLVTKTQRPVKMIPSWRDPLMLSPLWVQTSEWVRTNVIQISTLFMFSALNDPPRNCAVVKLTQKQIRQLTAQVFSHLYWEIRIRVFPSAREAQIRSVFDDGPKRSWRTCRHVPSNTHLNVKIFIWNSAFYSINFLSFIFSSSM